MKRRDVAILAVFAAVVLVFCMAVEQLTSSSSDAELRLVRDAVKNAALTCYAVEGAYPENLEYLRTHYDLGYNEERYIIYYDAFASNVLPDIRVVERGQGAR